MKTKENNEKEELIRELKIFSDWYPAWVDFLRLMTHANSEFDSHHWELESEKIQKKIQQECSLLLKKMGESYCNFPEFRKIVDNFSIQKEKFMKNLGKMRRCKKNYTLRCEGCELSEHSFRDTRYHERNREFYKPWPCIE